MENHITINQIFSLMPIRYKIRGGVERLVIDNFIKSDNRMDWISSISKKIRRDPGGVEKIVKDLTKKDILKEIECPQELIEKKGKGGAKPRTCYLLNYDMNPEWFVEIARPHLINNDRKKRLDFMRSEFTQQMIPSDKFIDWIIEKRLCIEINDKENFIFPYILKSFPSTLQWVLFGDLSIIDRTISMISLIKLKIEIKKNLYFSYLNSLLLKDFVEGEYLINELLSQINYCFSTEFTFLKPSSQKHDDIDNEQQFRFNGGALFEFKKNTKKKQ